MVERPPPPDLPTRPKRSLGWWDIVRATGLALLAYEAVLAPDVRPALLVVYVGMMGLPPVLGVNNSARRIIEKLRDDR